jgi:hypothetical protein
LCLCLISQVSLLFEVLFVTCVTFWAYFNFFIYLLFCY